MVVNETTLTPSQAAQRLGIGAHNIRRWCDWHSAYLSEGASPKQGAPRRLTLLDVEVLKTVNDLRKQGLQTIDINAQLAGMTFAVVDDSINSAPIIETPVSEPEAQRAALVAYQYVDSALQPVHARLEAVERSQAATAQRQRDAFIAFGAGAIFTAILFLIIVVIAWLYGG